MILSIFQFLSFRYTENHSLYIENYLIYQNLGRFNSCQFLYSMCCNKNSLSCLPLLDDNLQAYKSDFMYSRFQIERNNQSFEVSKSFKNRMNFKILFQTVYWKNLHTNHILIHIVVLKVLP